MGTSMLDTYSMVKKLQAAGVPEKQAEAQVAMVFEVAEKTFATKADFNNLGAELRKLIEGCATKEDLKACATKEDLKACARDLRKDMDALQNALLLKLGGLIVVMMGLGFEFLKFALKH